MNVSVNPQPCPASTPVIMCRTIKKPAGKTTCRAGQHVLEVLSSRIGFLPTENQDKILVQILGTLGGLSSNITSSLARQISHIVYRGNVLYLPLLLNHHMKIEKSKESTGEIWSCFNILSQTSTKRDNG